MATIAKSSITLVSISDAYSVSLQPSNITINADPYGKNPKLENAFTIISLYCGDEQVPISSGKVIGSSLWTNDPMYGKLPDCVLSKQGDTLKLLITQIGTAFSGWREIEVFTNAGQRLVARFSYTIVRETSMLDWILEWDKNYTEITGDHVATPNAFVGNKDDNGKLSGVYMGADMPNHSIGIYGVKDCDLTAFLQGNITDFEIFHLNSDGGMIGGWEILRNGLHISNDTGKLQILSNGTIHYLDRTDETTPFWELKNDGSGSLAHGNIYWGTDGSATFQGEIQAQSGKIGGWIIGSNALFNNNVLLLGTESYIGVAAKVSSPTSLAQRRAIQEAGGICIFRDSENSFGIKGYATGKIVDGMLSFSHSSPEYFYEGVRYSGCIVESYYIGSEMRYRSTLYREVFSLGANNSIAGWSFDVDSLWLGAKCNTSGVYANTIEGGVLTIGSRGLRGTNWYIDSDGTIDFVDGRLHFDSTGGTIAGWKLNPKRFSTKHAALISNDSYCGLYLTMGDIADCTDGNVPGIVQNHGGIQIVSTEYTSYIQAYENSGKSIFYLSALPNDVNWIGGWCFDGDAIFRGPKVIEKGKYTSSDCITLGAFGLRGPAWRFEADGSGAVAKGNISWGADGKVTFSDKVSLSWSQIDGTDGVMTEDTYIDSRGIFTGQIDASLIKTGKLSAEHIDADELFSCEGKWALLRDGSGYLASNNISWEPDGTLSVKGVINAVSGSIGDGDNKFEITSEGIAYGNISSWSTTDVSQKLLLNPAMLKMQYGDSSSQVCKIYLGKGARPRSASSMPYATVAWIYKKDLVNSEAEGSRCLEPAMRIDSSAYYGCGVSLSTSGAIIAEGALAERGYYIQTDSSLMTVVNLDPFFGSVFIIKNDTADKITQLPNEGKVRFLLDLAVNESFAYKIRVCSLPGNKTLSVSTTSSDYIKFYYNGALQNKSFTINANTIYEFTLVYDSVSRITYWYIKNVT